jgi:hypothetical protein
MHRRTDSTRYDWPVDGGPARYITSSVNVGVVRMMARHTPKLVLTFAILFGGMAASSALTTGVSRIDSNQRYASESGLVGQKRSQLRKSPGVQNCSLLPSGRNPFPDASQVFNGKSALGAFGFSNDLLTDVVIDAGSESTFASCEFLQSALCRSGLEFLEFRPQFCVTMTNTVDGTTTMPLSVRSGRYVGDTKVHPEEIHWLNRSAIGNIYCTEQIKSALTVNEIGLPFNAVESLLLVFSVDQWNNYPTFRHRPQTYAIHTLEAHDALVVSDCAMGLENWTDFLVALKAFHGFTDGADCHLGGESKATADLGVGQFMYARLTEYASRKSALRSERSGLIDSLHGCEKPLCLFGIGQKLQLESQFQYYGVYHSDSWITIQLKAHRLKGGGIYHEVLI